jgi:hypothetical protein
MQKPPLQFGGNLLQLSDNSTKSAKSGEEKLIRQEGQAIALEDDDVLELNIDENYF